MIALVGLVLRLVDAGARINDDEGYSWLVASAPSAGAFLSRLARFENTPPLFYLLLTPLPLSSEVWLRLLSELTAGPNGDGSGATGETDVMCYDEAGRLTQVNQSLSPNVNGESGFDTDQTYDANGNVTSRSVNGNLGQTACPPAGDTQSPPSYSGGQQTTFVYNNLDEEKSMSVQSTSGVSPAQPSRTYTTTNHCAIRGRPARNRAHRRHRADRRAIPTRDRFSCPPRTGAAPHGLASSSSSPTPARARVRKESLLVFSSRRLTR